MNPDIRKLESTADLDKCVEIQVRVWGLKNEETVAASTLKTCLRHGALLIGAFIDGELAGFCFSLPSFWKGSRAHHSHMLAVLPGSRDQGIGFRLKQAQFQALKDHCRWITWTFDPLESRNARLNLKLGVSIDTYIRDLYGSGDSCELHQGIGTDRFIAEWPTLGGVEQIEQSPLPVGIPENRIIETGWDPQGFYTPLGALRDQQESPLFLEIPADIQRIKSISLPRALEWRSITRETLEHYFTLGFKIRRFHSFIAPDTGARRSFYILTR